MMSGDSWKLTKKDALAYLNVVKITLQDEREKYESFLDVMKDFRAKRLDIIGCIAKVKELFKGHRGLIIGFNVFVPMGYEIMLPLEDEQTPLNNQPNGVGDALYFKDKIKVDVLLKSHEDLLNEFTKLLPKLSNSETL